MAKSFLSFSYVWPNRKSTLAVAITFLWPDIEKETIHCFIFLSRIKTLTIHLIRVKEK